MWSFHLTLSVLNKVWFISDTKAGSLSDPMERGSPYLRIVSLSRAWQPLVPIQCVWEG